LGVINEVVVPKSVVRSLVEVDAIVVVFYVVACNIVIGHSIEVYTIIGVSKVVSTYDVPVALIFKIDTPTGNIHNVPANYVVVARKVVAPDDVYSTILIVYRGVADNSVV
jgi:hypothetical protein